MIFRLIFISSCLCSLLAYASLTGGDILNERAKAWYTENRKTAIPHEVLALQWMASWFNPYLDADHVNTYLCMYQRGELVEPRHGKQMYLRELRKEWPSYENLNHFSQLRAAQAQAAESKQKQKGTP
jgi:hypothetical protein